MRKIIFLVRLGKEGQLRLVEISKEISDSYIDKSESNLVSAKILLKNNRLEESVSLAYYSMYHAATSLLFRTGIKCQNHAGVIILLSAVFSIDNSAISLAKEERIDKQYYVDFHVTYEEVMETIRATEVFNRKLADFISKLDSQKVSEYRAVLANLASLD